MLRYGGYLPRQANIIVSNNDQVITQGQSIGAQTFTRTSTVTIKDGTATYGYILSARLSQTQTKTNNPNTSVEDYPDVPQTGDNGDMALWYILPIVSVLGIAGITLLYRRRQKDA